MPKPTKETRRLAPKDWIRTARFYPPSGLYGAGMNSSADYLDFSAYYFLKDEFGGFDTQYPADWSATTVLLVDWELTISNKNVDLQNSGEET